MHLITFTSIHPSLVHPACRIFKGIKLHQSIQKALPFLSIFLLTENVVKELVDLDALATSEGRALLLEEVEKSVCYNYQNLLKLANILMKCTYTERVGHAIRKEYSECNLSTV